MGNAGCIKIQPPFITTLPYDESAVDTTFTDTFAICLICWPIVAGLLAARFRQHARFNRLLSWSIWIGVRVGIHVLVGTYFIRAMSATDDGLREFLFGQGVGVLGIGWLILLWICWSRTSCSHTPTTVQNKSFYWQHEASICIKQRRDADLFDREDMARQLPDYIRQRQSRFAPYIASALWLALFAALIHGLVVGYWTIPVMICIVLFILNAFLRYRARRWAFIHYAIKYSTNRLTKCRRCGYNLQCNESKHCPECGAPTRWGNKKPHEQS
jgi:ribosomal protein L37E